MSELLHHSWTYWTSGGVLLIPLAVVSVAIWGFFLRSRERLKSVIQEEVDLEKDLNAFQGLTTAAHGPIHHFLARVQEDIASGAPARESFHNRESECMEGLRRDIVILSALTAVAPLLGLLGTVKGMISTFGAVAQVAGDTGIEVAGGISQALITTQFGLLVALPGVFSVSRLKSLLSEAQQCMGSLRARFMASIDAAESGASS